MSDQDQKVLKIEFDQPSRRNKDETRSKYLHMESFLYFHILDCQDKLRHSGLRFSSSMAPHVEILNNEEAKLKNEKDLYLQRVKDLQGKTIDITDKANYKVIGRAFCLILPTIESSPRNLVIKICQLQHIAPNINRFTNVILNENYSTFTEHEYTVFD